MIERDTSMDCLQSKFSFSSVDVSTIIQKGRSRPQPIALCCQCQQRVPMYLRNSSWGLCAPLVSQNSLSPRRSTLVRSSVRMPRNGVITASLNGVITTHVLNWRSLWCNNAYEIRMGRVYVLQILCVSLGQQLIYFINVLLLHSFI